MKGITKIQFLNNFQSRYNLKIAKITVRNMGNFKSFNSTCQILIRQFLNIKRNKYDLKIGAVCYLLTLSACPVTKHPVHL